MKLCYPSLIKTIKLKLCKIVKLIVLAVTIVYLGMFERGDEAQVFQCAFGDSYLSTDCLY